MKSFKCDRCGKVFTRPMLFFWTIKVYRVFNMPVDLCYDCQKSLINWLKGAENDN